MGGDRGVAEVVRGMEMSLEKNPRLRYIVHGDGELLTRSIRGARVAGRRAPRSATPPASWRWTTSPPRCCAAPRAPACGARIEAVKAGESPVVISGGNTGALMALSMLALRKAPGVNRPAIAVLWPSLNPQGYNILLDAGADIRADAEDLLEVRGDGRLLRPQRARR